MECVDDSRDLFSADADAVGTVVDRPAQKNATTGGIMAHCAQNNNKNQYQSTYCAWSEATLVADQNAEESAVDVVPCTSTYGLFFFCLDIVNPLQETATDIL